MVREGIYEHYKGNRYAVIGNAKHSETLEDMVIYKALYFSELGFGAIWVRPTEMFCGVVEIDGKEIPRFKYVDQRWNNDLDIKEIEIKGD